MRLKTRMTLMQVATVVAAIVALCWVFVQQISRYGETEMEKFRTEMLEDEKTAAQGFRADGCRYDRQLL